MVIDFTKDKDLLTEDYMRLVGEWSKWFLDRMYGDELNVVGVANPKDVENYLFKEEECGEEPKMDVVIRGKYHHVKAYAQALGREKDYIVAYNNYGKDHPATVRAKAELDKASKKFESLTGIMWPFK